MDKFVAIASSAGFFICLLVLAIFTWHIDSLRSALASCSQARAAIENVHAPSENRAAMHVDGIGREP